MDSGGSGRLEPEINRKGFDSNTTTNRYLGEESVYGNNSKSKRNIKIEWLPGKHVRTSCFEVSERGVYRLRRNLKPSYR